MPKNKKISRQNAGCGCGSIPVSLIVVVLGASAWGFTRLDDWNLNRFVPEQIGNAIANLPLSQTATPASPPPTTAPPVQDIVKITAPSTPVEEAAQAVPTPAPAPPYQTTQDAIAPQTPWQQKEIRGIYLSRYQATNNASEQAIRERVRYYQAQGFNTIIHGVWGNGCTMYPSEVMQQTFGMRSCPNQFQDDWIDWLIDEAHQQGMQVHAYFEKGIKLDENSPIFDEAIASRWIVPGVDRTYPAVDHYLLDVEDPKVASFFNNILVEFVQKYPEIDAVQWDDYLGYHDDLPGKVDRTEQLTAFVRALEADMKAANPDVSFDICHHNPYWGARHFAADWDNWNVDRAFIQIYNDDNFAEEIAYAEQYAGVAITENQLHRLDALVNNDKIGSILVFPAAGQPEEAAVKVSDAIADVADDKK
ncbi:MAG: family 10 glycosylhydrolase [Cyanobacteria bacterium J06628_6]